MLDEWQLIEVDLHEHYGIDALSALLDERPAAWLRVRIAGLLGTDSRLARKFQTVAPLNVRYQTYQPRG